MARFLVRLVDALRQVKRRLLGTRAVLPPEKVLFLESADLETAQRALETIARGGLFVQPEITLLCAGGRPSIDGLSRYSNVVRVAAYDEKLGLWGNLRALRRLAPEPFDAAAVICNGDPSFRKMRRLGWLLRPAGRAKHLLIFNEAGGCFYFNLRLFLLMIYRQRRHRAYLRSLLASTAPRRVLVLQSAEPEAVLRTIETVKRKLFPDCRITLFCARAYLKAFEANPLIERLIPHDGPRRAARYFKELRRQGYSAVVAIFTPDRRFWKIRLFAFLPLADSLIIFNQYGGCFYFNLKDFLRLLWDIKLRERLAGYGSASLLAPLEELLFFLIRLALFPWRYLYLLVLFAFYSSRRKRYLRSQNISRQC